MDVGLRLKELRLLASLSNPGLAKASGVSSSVISSIETGKALPNVDTLERLCSALGISLADFFAAQTKHEDPQLSRLLDNAKHLTSHQLELVQKLVLELAKSGKSKT